jgi:hypothetical protein
MLKISEDSLKELLKQAFDCGVKSWVDFQEQEKTKTVEDLYAKFINNEITTTNRDETN